MVTLGQFKNYFDAVLKVDKLHPYGATLAQVARKIRNPNVTIDELADLIKGDASFAAEIIRTSNSAFYGSVSQTTSLPDAMIKVGIREIVRLLGLSLSRSMTTRDLSGYKIPAQEFWRSSVATAVLAEMVAPAMNVEKDEAYLAGLLHSTGLVVMDQVLRDAGGGDGTGWDRLHPLYEWELATFGFSHATAGAALLRKWTFPDDVLVAVEQQWAPFEVGPPNLTDCLRICRVLLTPLGSDLDKKRIEAPGALQFLEAKKINGDELWALAEKAREKFEKVFATFRK